MTVIAERWRKKPVVVDAVQLTDANAELVRDWVSRNGGQCRLNSDPTQLDIVTLEGTMAANPGHFVIRGVRGEFYPCDPEIFEETYEPEDADDSAVTSAVEVGLRQLLVKIVGRSGALVVLRCASDGTEWSSVVIDALPLRCPECNRLGELVGVGGVRV